MSKDTAELVGAMSTAALAVLGIIGLAVRFVLLPWLREHLVGPLLARLDTLSGDLRVASRMYEGHIEASGNDRANLWAAVNELRDALSPRRRLRIRREDTHP